jgi:hypothetical protein
MAVTLGDPALAARLQREQRGAVLFDRASRGRYATDGSRAAQAPASAGRPSTAPW